MKVMRLQNNPGVITLSALVTLFALVLGRFPAVGSDLQSGTRPKYEQWKLVAQSDLILTGQLSAPAEAIRAAVASHQYSYLRLHANVAEALKGEPDSASVEFAYYPEPRPYAPSPQTVIAFDGQRVLVFLHRSDTPTVAGLYFAGYTPKALQTVDYVTVRKVREEIQNQRRVIAAWRRSKDARPDASQKRVQALIHQMLDKGTEETAFQRLEHMGQAALPSMIRLMDDRRPLPIPAIDLENKNPAAFEGIRHYGPAEVVDAVAALLNQITGEDFGSIYNGGSERERRRAVDGWRVYLHYRLAENRSISHRGITGAKLSARPPERRPGHRAAPGQ